MHELYHYCEWCGNRIHDPDEEVPIYILELPNDLLFFCSDDCLWDFVKDHTLEGWVNPKGSVDRD